MRATAVLVIGLLAGCAGGDVSSDGAGVGADGPDGRAPQGLPQPEALYALREKPVREGSPFGSRFRDVGVWELAGPFPDAAETAPRAGGQPWDALLDELLATRADLVVASTGMECFARESGRFLVEHRALPGLGLQRFLAGRCGVVTAPPAFATLGWELDPPLPLARAIDELEGDIADALREHAVGRLDVGMWMHTDGGRVDLVLVWGERVVRLDPIATRLAAEARVVVKGELLRDASGIAAAVTRGRFGFDVCEAQPEVALPRFHFVCPIDPADPTTWVSLQYLPPGAILERPGAQILIRAADHDADSYVRHRYTGPRLVTRADEVSEAFLGLLSEVREEAGLAPLLEAPEQSRVAGELAPHYFSALLEPASTPVAERVALGLIAGWELPGIVRRGLFCFTWLVESRDVASLLADALEHPSARMVLLDPDVERIAIGALAGEGDDGTYVAAIASTYELFAEKEHRENASRVADGLARARAVRDRSAPRTLDEVVPLAVAAAVRVQAGGVPQDVLGDLIRDSVDTLGRPVTGFLVETRDLADIAFPDDFLERSELDIAIAVSAHRPEGEAWGRYVVLMVVVEPDRLRL